MLRSIFLCKVIKEKPPGLAEVDVILEPLFEAGEPLFEIIDKHDHAEGKDTEDGYHEEADTQNRDYP